MMMMMMMKSNNYKVMIIIMIKIEVRRGKWSSPQLFGRIVYYYCLWEGGRCEA